MQVTSNMLIAILFIRRRNVVNVGSQDNLGLLVGHYQRAEKYRRDGEADHEQ